MLRDLDGRADRLRDQLAQLNIWYWNYRSSSYDLSDLRPPEYNWKGANVGFETPDECDRRNASHVRILSKGGGWSQNLSEIIRACSQRSPCGSPACKRCMREWRRAVTGQALPIARKLERKGLVPVLVTLVFTDPELRRPTLPRVSLSSVKQRLRMAIRRAGLGGVPMIGGVEVDWNEGDEVWDLHVHLVAFVHSTAALDSLRPSFKKANGVTRPMQVDVIEDLDKAIPYCWKFAPMRKLRYERDGKTHSRKVGLRDRQLRSALLWLHDKEPEEFFYAQGGLKLIRGKLSMS